MSKPKTLYFTLRIFNPNEENIYSVNNFFVDLGRVRTFSLKNHFPNVSSKDIDEIEDATIIAYSINTSENVYHVFEIREKDSIKSKNIAQTILNLYRENNEINENTKIVFKEFQKIQIDLTDSLL